jgi:hypothetical protein
MSSLADTAVIDLDDDLQLEARAVMSRTPEPQNPFEVAVVLETLGYTDGAAQQLGSDTVFDLARRVHEVMADFGSFTRDEREAEEPTESFRDTLRYFGQGILYSGPWITAVVVLLTTGTAFWSSGVNTHILASGLTLSLFVALALSGCFIQAFARRATFYLLQDKMPLVRWTAKLFLGGGAIACTAVFVAAYFVLERGLAAYTPGTTRCFLALGAAIAVFQLALAPLYVMRAFGWLIASVMVGAAVVLVGIHVIGHGLFVNPFSIVKLQLVSIGSMVLVAGVAGWRLLGLAEVDLAAERAVSRPRRGAMLRSVSPYALYGTTYFLLIMTDQLVAGGLWGGHFTYDRTYELSVGAALTIVLPLFAYIISVSERFPHLVEGRLERDTVGEVEAFRSAHLAFYRHHLARVVALGAVASLAVVGGVHLLGGTLPLTAILGRHLGLLGVALGAYVALSVGVLNSQLLFALGRPKAPAVATGIGALVSLVIGGALGLVFGGQVGALCGLVGGTLVFATVTTVAARRAFSAFDATYYGAF